MKAINKNQIRLVIVIVCAVLLTGPAIAVAEETLLLASLTRTRQADEFKGYDFFPEHHREAQMKEKARQEKQMKMLKQIAVDEKIVSDAEWLSENAMIPYEVLTVNYTRLIDRIFTK